MIVMNYIVEFYKSLDTLNLILFWGIIIVIILLLTFSIIIANKNRKLKAMLLAKQKEEAKNETPIPVVEVVTPQVEEKTVIKSETPVVEKKFVAEEHVKEYNNDLFTLPNIDKVSDYQDRRENTQESIPTGPYQRNVLREMSSNQTSPIGIVKKEPVSNETIDAYQVQENTKEPYHDNIQTNHEYLSEVSKKLSDAKEQEDISRTEYELRQEEEAIISYEELMRKKDQIKIVDDEDAAISIEELLARKKQQEKLYNLNESEENSEFIKELKDFRQDL